MFPTVHQTKVTVSAEEVRIWKNG